MQTMADLMDELEATLKKIRVGDVVTGTVIDVTEDAVLVDLKSYCDGVIRKADLSEDPDFNMLEAIHPGDEITATVLATNDGEGNMVLSKKEANAILAWDKLRQMMEDRTVVKVKIQESSLLEPKETANEMAKILGAEFVQAIGRKFTLYRRAKEDPQIVLPR